MSAPPAPTSRPRRAPASSADAVLHRIVAWYFARAYGHWEGPGTLPYYCDPSRVGHFAVEPVELASGSETALFRLFVGMSMFQARRDVVIMAQQRAMQRDAVRALTSPSRMRETVKESPCVQLQNATTFDAGCSVRKATSGMTCNHHPRAACHVKDASSLLRRMGDMGKVPTSAWLHLWKNGRLARALDSVIASDPDPCKRAELLVERFATVYRVGQKLATMFVSALSTPVLYPGLTPWFPRIDGSSLVVVDTHVAHVVDLLRGGRAEKSYEVRVSWIRERAARINLQEFDKHLPSYSPRMVQQAIYVFRSKSNRVARRDACQHAAPCPGCEQRACPFVQQPTHAGQKFA